MKQAYYRDKNLTELARGQECLMRVPGVCNMQNETTVAAHSNQSKHGKGGHIKAHDTYSVWSCARCHTWLDQSFSADQKTKEQAWMQAFTRQIVAWKAIAGNISMKPVRVGAARRALEWLTQQKVI